MLDVMGLGSWLGGSVVGLGGVDSAFVWLSAGVM